MNKPAPKVAKDSPLAAKLLGQTLIRQAEKNNSPTQREAGEALVRTAQNNQGQTTGRK